MTEVIVIGAGSASVLAALRMAANDGPVPVRALAYAARLIRDAHQLPRYGITANEPALQVRSAARARA